jgi:hypothetical protein
VPRNSNTVHKVKARDPKSVAISTNKEGTTNNKIEKEKNRGRSISAAIHQLDKKSYMPFLTIEMD